MILRCTYILLAFILLLGCGAQKNVVSNLPDIKDDEPLRPDWIRNRPVSSMDYLGIGAASKVRNPSDYMQVAKSNAMSDLSSEIQVEVKSNSFLYVLERDYKFDEEFTQGIQTTSNQKLEDFEFVDSWESDHEYWVFYRLDRARYKENFERKRSEAIAISHDLFKKAQIQKELANIKSALQFYTRALSGLKDYWGESNTVASAEGEIYLENEILFNLQQMLNDIQIKPKTEDILLSLDNNFNKRLELKCTHKGVPLNDVKLDYMYKGERERVRSFVKSDEQGRAFIDIKNVDRDKTSQSLSVELDLENWLNDNNLIEREILKIAGEKKMSIPIVIEKPTFFITSTEKNMGNELEMQIISNVIKNGLTKKDFRLTTDLADSDLIFQLNAYTVEAGTSFSFHVAQCNMEVRVIDNGGNIIFQKSYHDVKGLNVDYESAGIKALSNVAEQVEKYMLKELIQSVL